VALQSSMWGSKRISALGRDQDRVVDEVSGNPCAGQLDERSEQLSYAMGAHKKQNRARLDGRAGGVSVVESKVREMVQGILIGGYEQARRSCSKV
jgi:hypothetical protein